MTDFEVHAPGTVRRQYADEGNLQTRRSVWQPTLEGRDPTAVALEEAAAAAPTRMLEVGCGTGAFAERVAARLPGLDLVALDQSERLVELTAARGVTAHVADTQSLPFPDDSFDVVAAMWMLYHVTDLHRGLAEVHRVLRPGGTFVAVTNGDEHVGELRQSAGGPLALTHFSSENGEEALRRHFSDVRREDLRTRAVFPDHAAAMAYLHSSQEPIDWDLPHFEGSREYAGHVTVFVAR
ncbi:class I SAM-dependent methyltransferase [Nocardioides psychrotolerans]|uniref:class I SAM-dependent methyltransferase n=1 Tax=Nocardioides psychrotolerans TaxID=1005945 RepID=UPI003137ACAC